LNYACIMLCAGYTGICRKNLDKIVAIVDPAGKSMYTLSVVQIKHIIIGDEIYFLSIIT